MIGRREFLTQASMAAASAAFLPRVRIGIPEHPWLPYRHCLAIDGLGGSGIFYLSENAPAFASQLQVIRDSG